MAYRNALRTKKKIKSVFLQLLAENEISHIRVKQILELADISKGTFYAHFSDVYAIFEEIEREHIEIITAYLNEQPRRELVDDPLPLILNICNGIENDFEFYRLLFRSKNIDSFLKILQKYFVDYIMSDEELSVGSNNPNETRLFFSFIIAGLTALLQDWYLCGCVVPLDKIANQMSACIQYAIKAIKAG